MLGSPEREPNVFARVFMPLDRISDRQFGKGVSVVGFEKRRAMRDQDGCGEGLRGCL